MGHFIGVWQMGHSRKSVSTQQVVSVLKQTYTCSYNDYPTNSDQYRFIYELLFRMHPLKLIQNVTLYRMAPTREVATSERHSGNHDDYTYKNHNIISVYLPITEHESGRPHLSILVPIKITLNETILSLWGTPFSFQSSFMSTQYVARAWKVKVNKLKKMLCVQKKIWQTKDGDSMW